MGPENNSTRREFVIKLMLTAVASTCTLPLFAKQLSETSKISFDEFMQISKSLTLKDDLDQNVGKKIYQHFKEKIDWKLLKKKINQNGILQTSKDPELKLIIVPLIRAWYVGVIFSEKEKPQFITYYDALMYRESIKVRNIPTNCGGEFGYWSEPPHIEKVSI